MSRVTPEQVKAIIDTSLDDPVIQVWIDAANTIVNSNADCIGGDEALLTQVELYLSAHFVGMLDPEIRGFVTKEKLEVFETTYSNPVSIKNNIDNTPYGTTANMLSNGCLANTSDKTADVCFF
tara:strand:+ start:55 stop:423 length:369 start_codon:yes stop_codon:yes gene_type:complete